jgi:adenylate kinase family enzyme
VDAGEVMVVTGPPGAGKSTVARLLSDRLARSVHLHTDDFWHFIKQGWVAPYRREAHYQNEVVMDVIVHAAFAFATGGYHVVVDGIVGPWFLPPFRAARLTTGVTLHYVVLRPDQTTTMQRATRRGGEALLDPEPIRLLCRQFSDLAALEPHVIDSTHLTIEQTVEAVRAGLQQGRYRLD